MIHRLEEFWGYWWGPEVRDGRAAVESGWARYGNRGRQSRGRSGNGWDRVTTAEIYGGGGGRQARGACVAGGGGMVV